MEEGGKGILRERWHFHFLFLALPLPFPLLRQPINDKGIFAPLNCVPCSVCLNFSFPALSSYFSCTFSSLQSVLILAFVYLVMLGIQIFYEVSLFCSLKALFPGEEERAWKTRLAQRMGWTELERDITDYTYFTIFFPLMIHKVERLCKEVPIDDPSKCPCAEEWDGMTLETWKHQTLWTNGEKCV